MSKYTEEQEDVQFSEPILPQDQVKLKVGFAERTEWEAKTNGVKNGEKYDACKLTLTIDDDSVRTEHEGAQVRRTIEDQFNIVQFPYEDKKTGEVKKLGRNKLYQLEESLGFEPVFRVNGETVEPHVTRNGNKVAPKIEGVKRSVNEDFFNAYFGEDGTPKMDAWQDKTVYAKVGIEKSEQFGNRNTILRYVRAPQM